VPDVRAAARRSSGSGLPFGTTFGAGQHRHDRGPAEHDRDSGTYRIQVRLARGPLRLPLRMRLDMDGWSATSTALELTPCGRARPTAAYFRVGHLLLDSLTRALTRHLPPGHAPDAASQPHVPAGSGVRCLAR